MHRCHWFLSVECCYLREHRAFYKANCELPRIAAYFTIFDVLLQTSPARVDAYLSNFAAIRANDRRGSIRCSVTHREIFAELIFVHINNLRGKAARNRTLQEERCLRLNAIRSRAVRVPLGRFLPPRAKRGDRFYPGDSR